MSGDSNSGTVCRHCGVKITRREISDIWIDGNSEAYCRGSFRPHEPAPAEQPLCDNPRCDGLTHSHGDGLQVVCPVASAEQPRNLAICEEHVGLGKYCERCGIEHPCGCPTSPCELPAHCPNIPRRPVAASPAEGPRPEEEYGYVLLHCDCGQVSYVSGRNVYRHRARNRLFLPKMRHTPLTGKNRTYKAKPAAQPVLGAKVEEIAEKIYAAGFRLEGPVIFVAEFGVSAKSVQIDAIAAILRPYFPEKG